LSSAELHSFGCLNRWRCEQILDSVQSLHGRIPIIGIFWSTSSRCERTTCTILSWLAHFSVPKTAYLTLLK
jgi:hypothetical protein